MTEPLSDEELVRRCRIELPYVTTAFAELLERYEHRVQAKCLVVLGDREDARDIAQDVFIKLFERIGDFRFQAAVSSWIYAVTVNTCLHQIERRKRRPGRWLTEDIEGLSDDRQQELELFSLVGEAQRRTELHQAIDAALRAVGERDRMVLEMRFLEELDYETMAGRLGIGLSALKMRLNRARAEFRKRFEAPDGK